LLAKLVRVARSPLLARLFAWWAVLCQGRDSAHGARPRVGCWGAGAARACSGGQAQMNMLVKPRCLMYARYASSVSWYTSVRSATPGRAESSSGRKYLTLSR